jgi:transcription antitermination factor NusG
MTVRKTSVRSLTAACSRKPRLEWFALNVQSRHEETVARSLRSNGLEEFVPISGRRRLFPGLVFCRFDDHDRQPVLDTPGVFSIAGSHESASRISDDEIARIKMVLASGLPVKPQTFLCAGQRVWITQGPLAGLEGFLVRKRDDFQVVVGVETLERSIAVEINREMVCAVEGAPHAQRARLFMTA